MYWLGSGGETLTETSLAGTINEEYIYFNGERIARIDRPAGTVNYYFSNHLGSASVITSATGVIQEQMDFYPFGGVAYSSGNDSNHYKFTGKERDTESGLDNFGARYFTSSIARFMTPDWAARPTAVPYALFGDPQSLNLYIYVRNDPVTRADADGHSVLDNEAGGCSSGGAVNCPISGEGHNPEQDRTKDQARNTAAAAVAASPTTMQAIDAVVKPLVDSAIGATEKAATVSLDAIGGVVLFIFASSQQTADEAHDTVHRTDSEKKDSAEPEPAAASGGQGVRGGKKDRSGQGNIDQLEGLEHAQQQTNKSSKGQYGLKTDKSKQNIDNANKRIRSLEDALE